MVLVGNIGDRVGSELTLLWFLEATLLTEWAVTVNLSERSHRQHPSFFAFLPFSRGFLGGGVGGVVFLGVKEGLRGGTAGRPGMAGTSSSSGSKQTRDV